MPWLALVAAVACSSSGSPASPGPSGATVAADAGPAPEAAPVPAADPEAVIGSFDIRLVPADPGSVGSTPNPAFVAVQGRVASAPEPPLLTLEERAREGSCRIEVPSAPFCESCRDGICIKGGICAPHPQPRSAGTVTIEGLATESGSAPVRMAPEAPRFFYQPGVDVKILYPPFAEGAAIRLSASGGDLPAFEVSSRGTAPLEITSPTPVTMDRGKPLALRWKAATVAGVSRIEVAVDISHHGGFKGLITCDTEDAGSLDVPPALVDRLLDLGVAGYPTVTVTRKTTAHARLAPGRVALNVIAERLLPIVITGYTSCSENDPCPPGKTCGGDGLCR